MLNWQRTKNKIFLRAVAFITAQALFITTMAYAVPPEKIPAKAPSPLLSENSKPLEETVSKLDKKTLRVPMGLAKNRFDKASAMVTMLPVFGSDIAHQMLTVTENTTLIALILIGAGIVSFVFYWSFPKGIDRNKQAKKIGYSREDWDLDNGRRQTGSSDITWIEKFFTVVYYISAASFAAILFFNSIKSAIETGTIGGFFKIALAIIAVPIIINLLHWLGGRNSRGPSHFSLLSIYNRVTNEGVLNIKRFSVSGKNYNVNSTKYIISDEETLGALTHNFKDADITFTVKGSNDTESLFYFLEQNFGIFVTALKRSNIIHRGYLSRKITIVLADKYDFMAGDHRQNNLIILNASDIKGMILEQDNNEYAIELITSLLSEELAHERGAGEGKINEEALAEKCAKNSKASLGDKVKEYIEFIKQYGIDPYDQKGYLHYLKAAISQKEPLTKQKLPSVVNVSL